MQSPTAIKLHYLAILILAVISVTGFAYTASDMDAGRDIFFAEGIVSGRHLPLAGPSLAQSFHASPLWFYFLSVPLFVFPSWTVMNLWVGAFAALKFPLAYLIGAELGKRNMGLLWASFLAIPGWHYFNLLSFTHTVMVEAAVLATLYCAVRWVKAKQIFWLMGCALCLSMALNAHPTAFVLMFVLGPVLLYAEARKCLGFKEVAYGAIAFVAPFLPYLFEQASLGWPDAYSSAAYVSNQSIIQNLLNVDQVLRGTVIGGWYASLYSVAGIQHSAARLLNACLIILLLLVATGLLKALLRPRQRVEALFLLYMLLIAAAGVSLIRNFTPFYMTFVLYPFIAVFMAYTIANTGVADTILKGLVVVSMIVSAVIHVGGLQRSADAGLFSASINAGNIQIFSPERLREAYFMPVSEVQALGEFICSKKPAAVYGMAATSYELAYGVPSELECGLSYEDFRVSYSSDETSGYWLGAPVTVAAELKLYQSVRIGNLSLHQVDTLLTPGPKPALDFFAYPIRDFLRGDNQTLEFRFDAPSGSVIAVSNTAHFFMAHRIQAYAAGSLIEKELEDGATDYFRSPPVGDAISDSWVIKITAPKPELIDIAILPTDSDF